MSVMIYSTGIVEAAHPGQGIGDIAQAGFREMVLDLSMYCSPKLLESAGKNERGQGQGLFQRQCRQLMEQPEMLQELLKPMLARCADTNLQISVIEPPYLSRNTKRTDNNGILFRLAGESIKLGGNIGCKYVVVRPLFAGISGADAWKQNRDFYLGLALEAKKQGAMILLENQCKDIGGHLVRGLCSDAMEAAEWVDQLNNEVKEECFGFCMDVGALNLCGQNMYDFCLSLGSRLKAVILRDCDGNRENAMLPFTCVNERMPQTDWLGLIRGLRKIGFDGHLLLNMGDTAAVFSPILRPKLLQLGKEVADYFKWQIEIERLLKRYPSRVLFGAGNMCRNYMKCYGKEYPPLYTCDNNSKLWGTDFCGLRVNPPDTLKQLPEDCAIFICNIYYREIEGQLRGMGIKNPVEFFNDEYMPTFYFDRLEDGGGR